MVGILLASEYKVGTYRKGSAINQKLCGHRQSHVQAKLAPLSVILKGLPEPKGSLDGRYLSFSGSRKLGHRA